jgi:hypothetical protein
VEPVLVEVIIIVRFLIISIHNISFLTLPFPNNKPQHHGLDDDYDLDVAQDDDDESWVRFVKLT